MSERFGMPFCSHASPRRTMLSDVASPVLRGQPVRQRGEIPEPRIIRVVLDESEKNVARRWVFPVTKQSGAEVPGDVGRADLNGRRARYHRILQGIQRCIELLWYGGDLRAEGVQALVQRIDALAE